MNIERLRELFTYEPDTGNLIRNCQQGNAKKGSVAGCRSTNGYINVCVDMKQVGAHRVAWAIATGEWPKECIDHINRVRSDNRFLNLREASRKDNKGNIAPYKNNAGGLKGVRRCGAKWQAGITISGKRKYLGNFLSPEEASAAYFAAAQNHFGDFASKE